MAHTHTKRASFPSHNQSIYHPFKWSAFIFIASSSDRCCRFISLLLLLCVTRDPVEIWQFSCFKRSTQIFTTKFELVLLPKQWVQEYEKCLTMRFTGCDGRKTKHNFNSFVSCWLSLLHAARQIHIQREFVYMCTTNKHQWKSLFIVFFAEK